jgi:hypothetical protein
MAKQRTTFAKLQRERAKAAKKAEKQAARIGGGMAPKVEEEPVVEETVDIDLDSMSTVERLFAGKGRLSAPELMSMTETIQRMHERGELDDDELEDAKLELLERID